MELIKKLIEFLKPIILQLLSKEINGRRQVAEIEPGKRSILDTTTGAMQKAIDYLYKNKYAFYAGKHKWGTSKNIQGRHNNILKSDYDGYLAIYRYFNGGVLKFTAKTTIPDFEYRKGNRLTKWYKDTFCNFAASIVYNCFVHGSPELFAQRTIQNWQGIGYSANSVIRNFRKGLYNTDEIKFIKVDKDEAEKIAANDGCVFPQLKPVFSKGHIAALTGEKDDYDLKPQVIQAGADFGLMSINQAFGNKINKVVYWAMVKA